MIKLMVFLGNPGNRYRLTRHNFAWRQMEEMGRIPRSGWQKKFKGSCCRIPGAAGGMVVLKPEVYMNKSGESVGAAASFYKLRPQEILVVHDDLELPFGGWALKQDGGLGGHNGLRSLSASLGSRQFHRFRMGIGRPPRGEAASFVLERFTPEEEACMPRILGLGGEILESLFFQEPKSLPEELKKGRITACA